MAGNDTHTASLLAVHPEADAAECHGDGLWATLKRDGYDPREVKCPECARERILAAVGSFIPPRFRDQVPVPVEVSAWAARGAGAQGLYLTGPVGTGKTHAAWMAVAQWCAATSIVPRSAAAESPYGLRSGPTVVFTRMTDLLDDLRPGTDSTQRVRDCQKAGLLVLDDLGAEKASEWTQERLYSVIDDRYARCQPLIVTSNLPPLKLAEQTGKRTASRLAEMCLVVPMTGTDRRMPAA